MLSPEYLAGLFDGEGTVSLIYAVRRPTKDGAGSIRGFRMRCGIAMTHRGVLEKVQKTCGGLLHTTTRVLPRCKRVHQWVINGAALQTDFLQTIQPYAVVKSEQIAVGLRYLSTVTYIGGRVAPENWAIRIECCSALKNLNRRGPERDSAHVPPTLPPEGWRPNKRYDHDELQKFMQHVRSGDGTSRQGH